MNEEPAPELTSHEKKELRKEEREEQKQNQPIPWKKYKGKAIGYGILAIILFLFILLLYKVSQVKPAEGYTSGPVHWHAYPTVMVCGEEKTLPYPAPSQHLGNPLLHTHAPPENYAHIEGQIYNKDDITLGKYFDAIGVKFSNTGILEKRNGEKCGNGKPGQVRMSVNGVPNTELRNHVLADGEKILITFE
ncbi:hypothetical protein HZB00_02065 [Candidatus Woesearchaeota archaeon]|nr:hypothetical protein [Candidatus Woesearchaeota archaeon]